MRRSLPYCFSGTCLLSMNPVSYRATISMPMCKSFSLHALSTSRSAWSNGWTRMRACSSSSCSSSHPLFLIRAYQAVVPCHSPPGFTLCFRHHLHYARSATTCLCNLPSGEKDLPPSEGDNSRLCEARAKFRSRHVTTCKGKNDDSSSTSQ